MSSKKKVNKKSTSGAVKRCKNVELKTLVNTLSDDKTLDRPKLNAFADDKINVFKKASFTGALKVMIVW